MKRILLAGVSGLAIAASLAALMRASFVRASGRRRNDRRGTATADPGSVSLAILQYFVVPLWLAAGLADWLCHRASDMEHTTGPKESALHLLMLAEVGAPVLATLFLEVTAPIFGLMIAGFALHEATALWDVEFAVSLREVTPIEQHVHSFLELTPLMAMTLAAVRHWPQFTALSGVGEDRADLSIRPKDQPLSSQYLSAVLLSLTIFEILPFLEELWRTWRTEDGRFSRERPSSGEASGIKAALF